MSRVISPLPDDRSPKRLKITLETDEMNQIPETIADIVADGDTVLVVSGMSTAPDTPIGFRVSSYALSMASPVLRATIANEARKVATSDDATGPKIVISANGDDGDGMFILCNILHLRNDKLPARVPAEVICNIALLAHKYQCVVAAGRATLQWFDRLYASKTPGDLSKIIEAAYLLDEALFFARFTSRWILEGSLHLRHIPTTTHEETQKLALVLSDHHAQSTTLLRNDLDTLIDTCLLSLTKERKHYIDWAPNLTPEPDTDGEKPPVECRVDPDAAMLYLGALRDAEIWPSTVWKRPTNNDPTGATRETIGGVVEKLKGWRDPEYNEADRCEFCDSVKIAFTEHLDRLKDEQEARLWGLCLDCYKAGGVNVGECRYEHAKAKAAQMPTNGLGIQGL